MEEKRDKGKAERNPRRKMNSQFVMAVGHALSNKAAI